MTAKNEIFRPIYDSKDTDTITLIDLVNLLRWATQSVDILVEAVYVILREIVLIS